MSGPEELSSAAALVERTHTKIDRQMLAQAIDLAELGRSSTRPNPVVGAVLANSHGVVIARAHHTARGAAHAERALLESLSDEVPPDATLYVSLEPCNHHGLTPPCVEIIIKRKVRRVVFACSDSNPITSGTGAASLVAHGISVQRGPRDLERRALQQNAGFHSVHLRKRPYVTAKWAMTRNRRFASGDPERRWISGPESRELVHYLRAGSGAIAVGIGTVLSDDPQLTVRGNAAEHMLTPPTRIIYDRRLRLPINCHLVKTIDIAPLLVVCAHDASPENEKALRDLGVEIWRAPEPEPGSPDIISASLVMLAGRRIDDVLLEAGPRLLTAFQEFDLIDSAFVFVAPFDGALDQPALAIDSPLLTKVKEKGAQSQSGEDSLYQAVLHPAWNFSGATSD